MKRLDRIILIILAVGVWGLIATMWLKPSNVDAHDDGHTHYEYAEEGHTHDYADSSYSHSCDVDGDTAECY